MGTSLRGLISLYSWHYPIALVYLLQKNEYRALPYLREYGRVTNFSRLVSSHLPFTRHAKILVLFVVLGMIAQVAAGITFIASWAWDDFAGGWQFGLAVILAYPLVWAWMLAPLAAIRRFMRPKALGRAVLCRLLEAQVRRLRKRHQFKVIGVAGSVGKTSTKIAIARVLQASRQVQWQEGNYNDRVTVPLIFFGHSQPGLFNVIAWIRILIKNEQILGRSYPYQFVVVELGTDGPGFIREFAYIQPDLVVVTAITPEHMEYFGTLDAVAQEELTALTYAKQALVNIDDTPAAYLQGQTFASYGISKKATYRTTKHTHRGLHAGQEMTFHLDKADTFTASVPLLGAQGAKIATAAAATAHLLGLPVEDIKKGVVSISAFAGRMQILHGVQGATIIDDSYNSTPIAAKAALDVLQSGEAPQRIAVLGSMNELGDYSPQAHQEVGEYCDPTKLNLVVTIGPDAKKYLAPVAEARGCNVHAFLSPYEAGRFVKNQLHDDAVVLVKGSQNRVFAEEAIKTLLADKADEAKLVRQSAYWMAMKRKQFKQ